MFLDNSFKVSSAKALCTRKKMNRSNPYEGHVLFRERFVILKFGNVLMTLYIKEYMNNYFKAAVYFFLT